MSSFKFPVCFKPWFQSLTFLLKVYLVTNTQQAGTSCRVRGGRCCLHVLGNSCLPALLPWIWLPLPQWNARTHARARARAKFPNDQYPFLACLPSSGLPCFFHINKKMNNRKEKNSHLSNCRLWDSADKSAHLLMAAVRCPCLTRWWWWWQWSKRIITGCFLDARHYAENLDSHLLMWVLHVSSFDGWGN